MLLAIAITIGHFVAILTAYSENILKLLWDNGRTFIFFHYVMGKSRPPPSPEIFVMVCHGSRDPPPSSAAVTYLLNGPIYWVIGILYIFQRLKNIQNINENDEDWVTFSTSPTTPSKNALRVLNIAGRVWW